VKPSGLELQPASVEPIGRGGATAGGVGSSWRWQPPAGGVGLQQARAKRGVVELQQARWEWGGAAAGGVGSWGVMGKGQRRQASGGAMGRRASRLSQINGKSTKINK